MRVFNQPAYTLINRPYSETSWIVEVFSRDYGRVGLMAKGARRLKSKLKGVLQPFQPVLLSWSGKGEVPTLTSAEVDQSQFDVFKHDLRHDALVCGFYCNELLVNLLHRHDPHPSLFKLYNNTIFALIEAQQRGALADVLRHFEQSIIKETGYEVSFLTEANGSIMIDDDAHYRFQVGQGFVRVGMPQHGSVMGRVIKSLHGVDTVHPEPDIAAQGKRLMREILSHALANKKIVSRDMLLPRQRHRS